MEISCQIDSGSGGATCKWITVINNVSIHERSFVYPPSVAASWSAGWSSSSLTKKRNTPSPPPGMWSSSHSLASRTQHSGLTNSQTPRSIGWQCSRRVDSEDGVDIHLLTHSPFNCLLHLHWHWQATG